MDTLKNALEDETQKSEGNQNGAEPKRSELEETKEKLLRLAADYENFRKRSVKDQERAYANGLETAIFPVLKIFDVFELALKASAKSQDVNAIHRGLGMVMAEFAKNIAELGIERMEDASGRDFDPAIHDAIMRNSSELVAEGKVIAQLNGGYRMAGRVIKAAQVIVSSGPEKPA